MPNTEDGVSLHLPPAPFMMSFAYQVTTLVKHNREKGGTSHNNRMCILKTFGEIVEKDFKLKKLENLKQKHILHVIEKWKAEVQVSTLKNRVSAIRWLCEKLGKAPILPRSNADIILNIPNREIDYNTDKGWNPSPDLKSSLPETQKLHVEMMREFGMRFQEAAKFRPSENIHDDKISIIYGTKGGRERDLEFKHEKGLGQKREMSITPVQREVLAKLKAFCEKNNVESLSRTCDKYKQFEHATRHIYKAAGMTKEGIGTPHGLRHRYAQDRYAEMTGWKAPANMEEKERIAFRKAMTPEQKELDRAVRLHLSGELGHGRSQVTSNYVGSWKE